MLVEIDASDYGKVKQLGIAIKMSQTPGSIRNTAPILGENTTEILNGLGYTKEEIESLQGKEAI